MNLFQQAQGVHRKPPGAPQKAARASPRDQRIPQQTKETTMRPPGITKEAPKRHRETLQKPRGTTPADPGDLQETPRADPGTPTSPGRPKPAILSQNQGKT